MYTHHTHTHIYIYIYIYIYTRTARSFRSPSKSPNQTGREAAGPIPVQRVSARTMTMTVSSMNVTASEKEGGFREGVCALYIRSLAWCRRKYSELMCTRPPRRRFVLTRRSMCSRNDGRSITPVVVVVVVVVQREQFFHTYTQDSSC